MFLKFQNYFHHYQYVLNHLKNNKVNNYLFSKKKDRDWECNSIAIDSRKVKPGNIFLAMPGTKFDGHDFVLEAIDAGASSIIVKILLQLQEAQEKLLLKRW